MIPIFNKNGEFSKKVYDGIFQASDYNIEQKFRNIHSKGIAVIGSIQESKLTEDEKKRFQTASARISKHRNFDI